eukprot:Opistho-2@65330
MADKGVVCHIKLHLRQRHVLFALAHGILAGGKFDPVASDHLAVDHKAHGELQVRLVGHDGEVSPRLEADRYAALALEDAPRRGHKLRQGEGDEQKRRLFVAAKAKQVFPLHNLHRKHGLRRGCFPALRRNERAAQLVLEVAAVRLPEALGGLDVKVRQKAVHVTHHAVARHCHAVHAHDGNNASTRPRHAGKWIPHVKVSLQLLECDSITRNVQLRDGRSSPTHTTGGVFYASIGVLRKVHKLHVCRHLLLQQRKLLLKRHACILGLVPPPALCSTHTNRLTFLAGLAGLAGLTAGGSCGGGGGIPLALVWVVHISVHVSHSSSSTQVTNQAPNVSAYAISYRL